MQSLFWGVQAQAWRVIDTTRRLIYNLLRSPKGLWDSLKICYNESKPQDAALTMENMDGDFFVVGTELVDSPENWKEIQASYVFKSCLIPYPRKVKLWNSFLIKL